MLWRQKGREGTSVNEVVMIKSFAIPWAPPAFCSLAAMLPPIHDLPFLLSTSRPTATSAGKLSWAEKAQPDVDRELYTLRRTLESESYL